MRRIAILGLLVVLAMVAMPAVSAAPDLIVTSVDVNPGNTRDSIVRVYVDGSNDITAVVHNNGPDDVPGDFDVCFEADGVKINCTTVTGGLTADTNTTVSITWTPDCTDYPVMPGFPPQSLPLTINVTADCDCANCPSCPDGGCGTYTETDETNNTYSKVIPAIQVYSTYNVIGGVVNNGYKSKNFDCDNTEEPLNQFKYYNLADGGMEYSVSGEKISTFAPTNTSTRVHHIDLPSNAVVKDARLYVYWYDKWGNYKTYPTGCLADLSVNFDSTDITPEVVYQDSKAFGYYQSPKGSSVFNVTSLVRGSGDYTAIVKNVEPIGGNSTTLLGEMLVVIYDSPCPSAMVPKVQIWMLEGTDYLMAADDTHNSYDYSVSPEEATATIGFGGSIDLATVGTAQLITVVAQGQAPGSDMLFNGNVIKTDAWDLPTEVSGKIDVEDVSVKSDLLASGNNMGFRDTGTGGMQAQNAFLIVEETPNATVYFEPSDIRVPEYGNNKTVGIWINSSDTLGSGTIIFDYTSCCANVMSFVGNTTNFDPTATDPDIPGMCAGTLTPGRVVINFATHLSAGLPANIPVHVGNMTIECNASDHSYCVTDLAWNCTGAILQNATAAWIVPVNYEDGTFRCNIPDLVVTMVKGTEILPSTTPSTYMVECTIKNVGDVNASESYASLEVDNNGVVATMFVNKSLAPGDTFTGTFALVIEQSDSVDDLLVCADYNNTVVETDETNNCMIGRYPGEVVISIQPVVTYVQPQDQFDVKVHVDTKGIEVYAVQYRLTYDTSVVRAETQVKGPFLGPISDTMVVINNVDQPHGEVSYAETRTEEGAVTDNDNVTNIHFIAIGERGDSTNLTLDDIIISNEDGVRIAYVFENGAVEITENTPPVPVGVTKHRINNVAQKYQSTAILCSCSYDLDYPGKGGNISYIRWAFGDGQYGTSEGLPIENCTCKEHRYESWQWQPFGVPYNPEDPELGGNYVPFDVQLEVTDDGCPEITNNTNFTIDVYIAGDANGDGEVNVLDAVWIGKNWHAYCDCNPYPDDYPYTLPDYCECDPCEGNYWSDTQAADDLDGADLNNDCEINVLDAVIIGANWRHTAW